jgi:hypothetical protein
MSLPRNKSDCGIAAVATVTGRSYAEVKRRFGRLERGGMLLHELDWLLNEYGSWHSVAPRKRSLPAEWIKRHSAGAFVVVLDSDPFSGQTHAIAAVDGRWVGEFAETWEVCQYWYRR